MGGSVWWQQQAVSDGDLMMLALAALMQADQEPVPKRTLADACWKRAAGHLSAA